MELTKKQNDAIQNAIESVEREDSLYTIGGYAGTGKTTVAKDIVKELDDCMVCAFTGKAAYRLREKGIEDASTIHSIIYRYDKRSQTFYLKDAVPGDSFLIDEGSMISKELWHDLNTFALPVIVMGDPGQLEPVGDDPNLMKDANIVLDEIHRQAEQSGIVKFATDVRKKRFDYLSENDYSDVHINYGNEEVQSADIEWADIIICGFNKTRNQLNAHIRCTKQYFNATLLKGERIICLQNNRKYKIFNGQMFTVSNIKSIDKGIITADCIDDMGKTITIPMFEDVFGGGKHDYKDKRIKNTAICDYGYCITCHKSQGSEWDNVLVIDEQCSIWDSARWRYTAITRAAKNLRYYF